MGIHWCTWDHLSEPKDIMSLGFHNLSKFNIALLAKQGCHIFNNLESFLARVLKAKYFLNFVFFSASLGGIPSYTWKSL